jgi:hypothetical protein
MAREHGRVCINCRHWKPAEPPGWTADETTVAGFGLYELSKHLHKLGDHVLGDRGWPGTCGLQPTHLPTSSGHSCAQFDAADERLYAHWDIWAARLEHTDQIDKLRAEIKRLKALAAARLAQLRKNRAKPKPAKTNRPEPNGTADHAP